MNNTRKYTNYILELMDEGCLDPKDLVQDLLVRMSEAEVKDFFFEYEMDNLMPED